MREHGAKLYRDRRWGRGVELPSGEVYRVGSDTGRFSGPSLNEGASGKLVVFLNLEPPPQGALTSPPLGVGSFLNCSLRLRHDVFFFTIL